MKLNKKLIAAQRVMNYLNDKKKSESFDVQELLLQEIMMINDISRDMLNVYHYVVCLITFSNRFVSISLLT